GSARPVRWAQPITADTDWKPWPCSPSGSPACAAAQLADCAHHRPTPAPATALRETPIWEPSVVPGGCSLPPTGLAAARTTAAPRPAPAGAVADATASGDCPLSTCWKLAGELDVEATSTACGRRAAAGDSIASICDTRARADSTLITHVVGRAP